MKVKIVYRESLSVCFQILSFPPWSKISKKPKFDTVCFPNYSHWSGFPNSMFHFPKYAFPCAVPPASSMFSHAIMSLFEIFFHHIHLTHTIANNDVTIKFKFEFRILAFDKLVIHNSRGITDETKHLCNKKKLLIK